MATQLQLQAESLNPQDLISVSNDQLRTTSLKVAEAFGKLHKDVLKKIDSLKTSGCDPEWVSANFCADTVVVDLGAGRSRKSKCYGITKDGFMMLVMGFTGKKAMAIKIAYINAFNWMADQLLKKQAQPPVANPKEPYRGYYIDPEVATSLAVRARQQRPNFRRGKAAHWAIIRGIWRIMDVSALMDIPQSKTNEALYLIDLMEQKCDHFNARVIEAENYFFKEILRAGPDFDSHREQEKWDRLDRILARSEGEEPIPLLN